jgi:hypothetical protein
VTETLILGLAFIVVGGLAVAHAVYTLRNRPKRDQGWWWGQHPLLTGLIAGWPVGYTGRLTGPCALPRRPWRCSVRLPSTLSDMTIASERQGVGLIGEMGDTSVQGHG